MILRLLKQLNPRAKARDPIRSEAAGPEAIGHQWLVDEPDPRSIENQTQPTVPVVTDLERLVPAAGGEHAAAADRRGSDETAAKDRNALVVGGERRCLVETTDDFPVDF